MISLAKDESLISFESFQQFSPHLTNFITTRHGGYSKGPYATFNPSPYSGDESSSVQRNLTKLCSELPQKPLRLFRPRQVHGTELRIVDKTFLEFSDKEQTKMLIGVDALATHEKGICICVSTADCIPVLLYDKQNDVISVVHAGWRGTLQRIVFST
jgi:copper oxidase (laccase) domain-containing protein